MCVSVCVCVCVCVCVVAAAVRGYTEIRDVHCVDCIQLNERNCIQ